MRMITRLVVTTFTCGIIGLFALSARAQALASGTCGVTIRNAQVVPLPCPSARATIDGAARNGVLPLASLQRPVRISGAYRVVETAAASRMRQIVIDGLVADNILREGIRLRKEGDFEGITIRNFSLTHAAQANVAPDLPEGIHVAAGRNILIENGTIRGFQMTREAGKYWNGDGIAIERNVQNVTLRNLAVIDNTDSGIDVKASDVLLDNVYAAGNARNIRLWSDTRATTLAIGPTVKRGGNSNTAGIWIKGSARPTITIDTLILDMGRSGSPTAGVAVEDGPATVTIGRCIIRSMPPGSQLVRAPNPAAVIRLGSGCALSR